MLLRVGDVVGKVEGDQEALDARASVVTDPGDQQRRLDRTDNRWHQGIGASSRVAGACKPTEQSHDDVLGGDHLVDEPKVWMTPQQRGSPVQGFARGQDHHHIGVGLQSADSPQRGRLGRATGDKGDLVRQPPQAARPSTRPERCCPAADSPAVAGRRSAARTPLTRPVR
ncbi:hypothetical protein [Streptomyces sanglieri]|uniref:hypothetical protein n=1 Tax=Streptomyces sanglieri TaxID=193460 RepID=UPI003524C764